MIITAGPTSRQQGSRPEQAAISDPKPQILLLASALMLLCMSACLQGAAASPRQPDPNDSLTPTEASHNLPPSNGTHRLPQKNAGLSTSIAVATTQPRHETLDGAPSTDLGRQVWRTNMRAYNAKEDEKNRNELRRMIEQVRSIEFRQRDKTPVPPVVKPIQQAEPNRAPAGTVAANPPQPAPGKVADSTLKILQARLQRPEQLENPFDLAEVLFHTAHLEQAAVCYKQALEQTDPNQPDPSGNRAWILFQIGNCLRNSDPPKAVEAYEKLIQQYPGSTWTDLAKARARLVNWYRQDKPRVLIEQNNGPTNKADEPRDSQ